MVCRCLNVHFARFKAVSIVQTLRNHDGNAEAEDVWQLWRFTLVLRNANGSVAALYMQRMMPRKVSDATVM